MSDKIREDFEAWMLESEADKAIHDGYDEISGGRIRNIMFLTWQASRAALVVELPKEPDPRSGGGDYNWGQTKAIEWCREAIHAAGVKTK